MASGAQIRIQDQSQCYEPKDKLVSFYNIILPPIVEELTTLETPLNLKFTACKPSLIPIQVQHNSTDVRADGHEHYFHKLLH
jgi:hypothetical protein